MGCVGGKEFSMTPHEVTGLSELDRHHIETTWALASDRKVIKENSVDFFLLLFQEQPYMLEMFPSFRGIPPEVLQTHPKMRAHALTVFYAIGMYVQNLNEPDLLVGLVQKIAAAHIQRNIRTIDFDNLARVFIKFLKQKFGDGATPEVLQAWTKLLTAQTAIVSQTEKEIDGLTY